MREPLALYRPRTAFHIQAAPKSGHAPTGSAYPSPTTCPQSLSITLTTGASRQETVRSEMRPRSGLT